MTSLADDIDWGRALLAGYLRPRARLAVSQWADAHRVLSEKASAEPGAWRTARTPYLREIMDALSSDSPAHRVCVMKSAQMGVTEAAVNWIGYVMDHVRTAKPLLVVVPTEKLLVRWRHQRLSPMIEAADCLRAKVDATRSRDGTNRIDLLDYPGGLLYLTTAGSASNLKSDSLCYVVCDEADEYDWDVGGRGDPLALIESRQSNFPRRKLLIFSTPTVKGSSRIEGEWERSDQRHYHIPCPHCGEHQPLVWEHLHWTPDLADVWYACAANGCVISERDKPIMLAAGRWVPTHPDRDIRGYHLSALYAPIGLGYSWTELARDWLAAQAQEIRVQAFVNERLGLPWEDRRTRVEGTDLAHRAEPYRLRELHPGGPLLVTAGIDTQDDRLVVQILGWGEQGRWWVLDYLTLNGSPSRPEVWVALTELLARPLTAVGGAPAPIEAACIDLGGHHAEEVKAYARSAAHRRLIPIIGSRYRLPTVLGAPKRVDYNHRGQTVRHGMKYFPVGTEVGKDKLFQDLRSDTELAPADRRGHFSAELTPEYYEGLVSEVWNPKRNRYEPRRGATRRNEPLDTWVYALAAAHHPELRLDRLRAQDWAARQSWLWPATGETPPDPPAEPVIAQPRPAPAGRARPAFVPRWKKW